MSKLVFYYSNDQRKCTDLVLKREEELSVKGVVFRRISCGQIDRLKELPDERLALFGEYIIEDAGDCTALQADFVIRRLKEGLGLDVTAVGLRCGADGRPLQGAMAFLAKADEIRNIDEDLQGIEPSDNPDDEPEIPPHLAQFLDADTASDRLEVFRRIREKCDDQMIDTIAVILDMEIPEGDIERRRQDVVTCLETKIKYELTRR